MSIFTTPVKEIDKDDIQELVEKESPEGHHLEFKCKRLLQGKWEKDGDIPKNAYKKIAKEIVAFANADGGICIIGIKENGKVAVDDESIKNPEDLADRIVRSLNDRIEPTIPNLNVVAVEIDESGGVVVFKVEKSYQAPHRRKSDNECFIRRNEQSEPMIMREIKDLTLRSANIYEEVQKRFGKRYRKFSDDFSKRRIPQNYDINSKLQNAFRITLIPISNQVIFPDILERRHEKAFSKTLEIETNGDHKKVQSVVSGSKIRPILRGKIYYGTNDNFTVKEDGLVEFSYVSDAVKEISNESKKHLPIVYGRSIIGYLFKTLLLLEDLKKNYGHPDVEYAMEIDIISSCKNFVFNPLNYSSNNKQDFYQVIGNNRVELPQYSYKGKDEIERILNLVNEDIHHISGSKKSRTFNILTDY